MKLAEILLSATKIKHDTNYMFIEFDNQAAANNLSQALLDEGSYGVVTGPLVQITQGKDRYFWVVELEKVN